MIARLKLNCGHTIEARGAEARYWRASAQPGRSAGCTSCQTMRKVIEVEASPALPTVHLNGTGVDALFNEAVEAGEALRTAAEAVARAAPNARDYYPQGPGAFDEAQREHEARLAALARLAADYEAIAEHLAAERDRRKS